MSAERWYRALLRAYPAAFRAGYEHEMVLLFRQCRLDAAGQPVRFWLALLRDVLRSAPALRLEAARARWSPDLHIREAAMKAMASLATVAGLLEVVNSLIEGAAGWPHRDAPWLASVCLGVLGGVVLMVAGGVMLRGGRRATPQAFAMAAACLVAFVLIGFIAPVMSGLGMLVGVGFPIVLLAFLLVRRRREPRVPGVA